MRKLATLLIALFVSSSALAATPSEGVPLQVRRGFFTETDVGVFFTLGPLAALPNGDTGNETSYSNAQTYLQVGAGYQFTLNDGAGLIPVGFHVGIGSNAAKCWSSLTPGPACAQADNFTTIFLNVSGGYLHRLGTGYIGSRVYAGGKLLGGVTLVDPDPVGDGVLARPNFGVAASVEFATSLDHFSIGADASYRLIIGPNINALMFYFRVQYTF